MRVHVAVHRAHIAARRRCAMVNLLTGSGPAPTDRVTETGDPRVTETGDTRPTEGA
jgi:hypothetical protein